MLPFHGQISGLLQSFDTKGWAYVEQSPETVKINLILNGVKTTDRQNFEN